MKKSKHSKHNFISILLLIIGMILFIYSAFNITIWFIHSNQTKNIITKINNIVTIEEDDSKINVDLLELKKINPDVIGWIQVPGTEVNYPFTQTSNNDFYLNHSFDKSYNSAGWIFLDYRNDINNLSKNTIFYAHGRLDNTMFGSLKNIFNSNWYNNSDNYIIKISSEEQDTSWEIFSVYHIPTTSDYIKIDFNSDDEFIQFVNMLKSRSFYNFNKTVESSDNIVTLSTCYNNNSSERLVIHAKLIK